MRSECEDCLRFEEGWGGSLRTWRKLKLPIQELPLAELPLNHGFPIGPCISETIREPDGSLRGMFFVARQEGAPAFSEEERLLVYAITTHLATDIANRRLQMRLNALTTLIDEATSAKDPDKFLTYMADEALTSLGFARCAVFLVESGPKGRCLSLVVNRGYPSRSFPSKGLRCSPDTLLGTVVCFGRTIVGSSDDAHRGFRRMMGASSFVAVPILSERAVIGVMLADNRIGAQTIGPERTTLLALFADQAGGVLERLRSNASLASSASDIDVSRAFLQQVLESLGAGVAAIDGNGNMTAWNPRMEAILGIPAADVLGQPLAQVFQSSLRADSTEPIVEAIATGIETNHQTNLWQQRVERLDGQVLALNMVFAPMGVGLPLGSGLTIVAEDVTDRVILGTEMERMRHLAQVGQFTAQIAHELRNPLTSIRGAAQLLRQLDVSKDAQEFSEIILQEVNALNGIADDFLDFARPVELHLEEADIAESLEELANLWKPMVKDRGIRITLKHGAEVPKIWIDRPRMAQVFRNLILNAIQAMPDGGKLALSSSFDPTLAEVSVFVRDSGFGMTPDQVRRVFEPFFTTKTKGTGLGMSVVDKLVRAHGGSIGVRSDLGKGTEFEIRLSAHPPVQ